MDEVVRKCGDREGVQRRDLWISLCFDWEGGEEVISRGAKVHVHLGWGSFVRSHGAGSKLDYFSIFGIYLHYDHAEMGKFVIEREEVTTPVDIWNSLRTQTH